MRRFLIAVCIVLGPLSASGATLSFDVADAVRVSFDAEGQSVNLIQGRIVFGEGAVESIETGGSIVTLWIEEPRVVDGGIEFAGLIPGGFQGVAEPARGLKGAGLLFAIAGVHGPASGTVSAYLHDGSGTEIPVAFGASGTSSASRSTDTVPPDAVDVALLPASDVAPRLLVALGDDAETGVARYEVSVGGGWREFTPPLEMPNEEKGRIAVRIFDHSGNYREVVVQEAAHDPMPRVIVSLLMLLIVGLAYIGLRRRRRA